MFDLSINLVSYVVAIIVIIIICLVYYYTVTRHSKSSNDTIYKKLFMNNPNAIAFSIGKQSDGTYLNVYINSDSEFEEKYEAFPVKEDGNPLFIKNHGDLLWNEDGNGFKIEGIDYDFRCPEGYEGQDCSAKSPCNDEPGKIKPITYTMFKSLGLNQNNFDYIIGTRFKRADEPLNNRLYIICGDKQEYEIHGCPINKVLDTEELSVSGNVVCNAYDVCTENLNGYAHNFAPDGSNVENNQYFVCSNGESVPKTCADGLDYSIPNHTCILPNRCYKNDGKLFPLNDTQYTICANDADKIITCPNGVDKTGIACIGEICVPSESTNISDYTDYVYSVVTCDEDNNKIEVSCDTSTKTIDLYQNTFTYPSQIYKDGACVDVTDPKTVATKLLLLNYNNRLTDAFPFDPKTDEYDCTGVEGLVGTHSFQNGVAKLVDGTTDKIYNYSVANPCITTEKRKLDWDGLNGAEYDKDLVQLKYNGGEAFSFIDKELSINDKGEYVYKYVQDSTQYIISTSDAPPYGYIPDGTPVFDSDAKVYTDAIRDLKYPADYPDGTTIIDVLHVNIPTDPK